ncbi:hypothetical protein MPSEU_000379900 [Mayamaea pseudoterrestris]|nr:hypothetical protein MPSEU_000379900 [Mayamaea pseudoterrestris]
MVYVGMESQLALIVHFTIHLVVAFIVVKKMTHQRVHEHLRHVAKHAGETYCRCIPPFDPLPNFWQWMSLIPLAFGHKDLNIGLDGMSALLRIQCFGMSLSVANGGPAATM